MKEIIGTFQVSKTGYAKFRDFLTGDVYDLTYSLSNILTSATPLIRFDNSVSIRSTMNWRLGTEAEVIRVYPHSAKRDLLPVLWISDLYDVSVTKDFTFNYAQEILGYQFTQCKFSDDYCRNDWQRVLSETFADTYKNYA